MKKILFCWILIFGVLVLNISASAESLIDKKPNIESTEDPEVRKSEPIDFFSPQIESIKTKQVNKLFQSAATVLEEVINLILNPSAEESYSNLPLNWFKGGYGTNTRTFTYPVLGVDGEKAIKVNISSYVSGDAKWYFSDVPVSPGTKYNFSDYYISDIPSIIDVRYKMNDGTYVYKDIADVDANVGPDFKKATVEFVAPQNAISATIFHLVQRVGFLITDKYSLIDISTPPDDGEDKINLISNPGFEEFRNGLPLLWKKGGWGTNTRIFSYPVISYDGSKAVKVDIPNYNSGDAKWYFNFINLPSGIYTYSEDFLSNIESEITVQYQNENGTYIYTDIARLPKSINSSFAHIETDLFIPIGAKNITIFHLIQGVGSLTIDNVSLKQKEIPTGIFETGAITFRFDDGWLSQYENAIPQLNSAGFKGTFYITSQQLYDYDFGGFVNKAQVKEMSDQGHEIGAHTKTHPHLTQLSVEKQLNEIKGSREDLLALGVKFVNSFSYPFGEYTSDIIQMVKDSGFTSASSVVNGYVTPLSDPYQLESQSIVITTTVDHVKKMIDEAIRDKKWLILEMHEIKDEGGYYRITEDTFGQIVEYVKQKNIPVVTIDEGIKSF